MKIVSFGERTNERAGILCDKGVIDMAIAADTLFGIKVPHNVLDLLKREDGLNIARRVLERSDELGTLPGLSDIRLGAPLPRPGKIICLGLNYHSHVAEQEETQKAPEKPLIFSKAVTTVIGPFDRIIRPKQTAQLDYEVELGVVIGKEGKNIRPSEAYAHVAGYTVFNDITARDIQMSAGQWFRGKSFDTFGPMGPWIVTGEEIGDENDLKVSLRVNGELMQAESTRRLIFKIPEIIADISEVMTLEAGDLIATGTPGGVGYFRTPPRFLKPGDEVEAEIERIGKIKNIVENAR